MYTPHIILRLSTLFYLLKHVICMQVSNGIEYHFPAFITLVPWTLRNEYYHSIFV